MEMRGFQFDGGNGMVMAGLQIFNLLVALLILAAVIISVVMLLKVLFKLNKALDVWLKEKENKKQDTDV